jgi:hypothetical protein
MSPSAILILKISIGLLIFSLVAYVGWRLEKSHKEKIVQEVVVTTDEEDTRNIDSN